MTEPFSKVFIDTAPFIYITENRTDFADPSEKLLSQLAPNCNFVTSVITITEFSVKPIKHNKSAIITKFIKFLNNINCEVVPIDSDIAYKAAELRAKYEFLKTPDALQIASAIFYGCIKFVTNDKKLEQISELEVVLP